MAGTEDFKLVYGKIREDTMNRYFVLHRVLAINPLTFAQDDVTGLEDVDFVMQGGEVHSGQ